MFLTAKEIAQRYRIQVSTVGRLASEGKFPKPLRVGGQNRWRLADIEKFEEEIA